MTNDDDLPRSEAGSSTAFTFSVTLGIVGVVAYFLLAATVAGSEPERSTIPGFGYFFVVPASPVGFLGACFAAAAPQNTDHATLGDYAGATLFAPAGDGLTLNETKAAHFGLTVS